MARTNNVRSYSPLVTWPACQQQNQRSWSFRNWVSTRRIEIAAMAAFERIPPMSERFNILPDSRFVGLKPALAERLAEARDAVQPANFVSLLDPLMREALRQGFEEAAASEGTVWLLDATGEHLAPAYNTGPNAAEIVGSFRQPLYHGLISMVFASEQPFVENDVSRNSQHSKLLDTALGQQTQALLAAPFYLFRECRGVVSCVQLQQAGPSRQGPAGFRPEALAVVQRATSIVTRLLEYRLLRRVVDWDVD